MATGLAHEIHNPLAAIRMHAQLIESARNGDLASTAHASLPVVLGETSKIEGLVQQWMFLARPQPPQTAPALQFRGGNSGPYTDVPAGYGHDASASGATLVTPVDAFLPAAADNQPLVQVRILMTDAFSTDEMIGVRYLENALTWLGPDRTARSHGYHQDTPYGTDRTGTFNMWIALDEVLPEQVVEQDSGTVAEEEPLVPAQQHVVPR